jgi:hypothetical protein
MERGLLRHNVQRDPLLPSGLDTKITGKRGDLMKNELAPILLGRL